MRNLKEGFGQLILLILVALIGIPTLILFAYQNKKLIINTSDNVPKLNNTAQNKDWKTYYNIKHNYTISYPSNFILGNGRDPEEVFINVDNVTFTDPSGGEVTIYLSYNPNRLSAEDWLKSEPGSTYDDKLYNLNKLEGLNSDYYRLSPVRSDVEGNNKYFIINEERVFILVNQSSLSNAQVEMMANSFNCCRE